MWSSVKWLFLPTPEAGNLWSFKKRNTKAKVIQNESVVSELALKGGNSIGSHLTFKKINCVSSAGRLFVNFDPFKN